MATRVLIRRATATASAWRRMPRIRSEPTHSTPLLVPLQRRFASSNSGHSEDRAPYRKGESVGNKPIGQFDVTGKVFVVTGAPYRFYPLPVWIRLL